jgi:NDP-sugar pyrophosphorylase family protein
MNGDILTDLNYSDFYRSHIERGDIYTISSHIREQVVDYGVLESSDGRLTELREKPRFKYEVSMGVYMMSATALELVPEGKAYGFDQLMHDLLAARQEVRVNRFSGYWLDIGRPDDCESAIEIFGKSRNTFLME